MSNYLSDKYASLSPYTPGEQPKDLSYIKLNTNESPFPPSEKALKFALENTRKINLYSDPDCTDLREAIAEYYAVEPEEVILSNGSDEMLNFAFMAFCDETHSAVFPNITYGLYPILAKVNRVPYEEIPLTSDLKINIDDYFNQNKTVLIANPNAPTGISLSLNQIEEIVKKNKNNVVIIDEAYVDFGGHSCIPLTRKYDNLLIIQTFSKSRSMAGARLGFAIGSKELISDLNTIRNSINPYNINSMTLSLGLGSMLDADYTIDNCKTIIRNRESTVTALKNRGFTIPDSDANFIFAKHNILNGQDLYLKLKSMGILVRHFSKPEISEYIRITIGTMDQMNSLIAAIDTMI